MLRAPAGFGKTTLIAHWLGESDPGADIVWARVRSGDHEPGGFWLMLLDALNDAGLPVPAQLGERSARATAERMIIQADRPLLAVLDGFDQADDGVDQALFELAWHAPHLRLVVSLRGHRHFRSQQIIGLGSILIGPHDLLFTLDETAQLLAAAGLDPDHAGLVYTETGGWPEPTVTLALALRARPDEAGLSRAAATIARDFLRRRLLPDATRADRVDFALVTAIPERVTAPIAEGLTGDPAARAQLEWLESEGLLQADTLYGEPAYRWPAAARQALLQELRRRSPDRLAELRTRLVRWYLDHDRPVPALRHALDTRDGELTVRAIEAGWRSLLMEHRELLYEALATVPLETLAASPRALAVRDIMLQHPDDRVLTAAPLPESVDALAELGRDAGVRDVLDTSLAVLVALRRRGRFDRAYSYAGQLLHVARVARADQPDRVGELLPGLHLQIATVRVLAGDLSGALYPLQRAYEWASDGLGLPYAQAESAAELALVYVLLGEPGLAAVWLQRYDSARDPRTWLEPAIRTTAATVRLLLALDRLDLSAAAAATDDTLINRIYTAEFWAFPLYARAQHALHTGGLLDALDQLDRDRDRHRTWLDHGAVAGPLLLAAEVDLLLALGHGNQARSALQGQHGDHPLLRIARARLALLTDNPVVALDIASDAAWAQRATARQRQEMLLIRSVAAHRTGDNAVAVQSLRSAVGAGSAGVALRAFTAVPRADLDRVAEQVPAAREVLHRIADHPELFPVDVTLVELTERERLLLHKLDDGLTIAQIARELVVSPNTIKTQRRTLYQKLSAASRADALASARSWGLLPHRRGYDRTRG